MFILKKTIVILTPKNTFLIRSYSLLQGDRDLFISSEIEDLTELPLKHFLIHLKTLEKVKNRTRPSMFYLYSFVSNICYMNSKIQLAHTVHARLHHASIQNRGEYSRYINVPQFKNGLYFNRRL